jgi:hypothetical protein
MENSNGCPFGGDNDQGVVSSYYLFQRRCKHFKELNLDCFFTTVNISEKDFPPSTMYDDYAINKTLLTGRHCQGEQKLVR